MKEAKDLQARDLIGGLRRRIDRLECSELFVKDCPVCKHSVMVRANWADTEHSRWDEPDNYTCLTCGVKFICTNKCVCEVVE